MNRTLVSVNVVLETHTAWAGAPTVDALPPSRDLDAALQHTARDTSSKGVQLRAGAPMRAMTHLSAEAQRSSTFLVTERMTDDTEGRCARQGTHTGGLVTRSIDQLADELVTCHAHGVISNHNGQANRSGKNDLAIVRSRTGARIQNQPYSLLTEGRDGSCGRTSQLTANHADGRFGSVVVGAAPFRGRLPNAEEGEQLDITITMPWNGKHRMESCATAIGN